MAKSPGRVIRGGISAIAVVAALVPLITAGTGAKAARYARSQKPIWHVGQLNGDLTDACRRGQFNQIHHQRHHIGFTGESGYGTVGIAKLGWNLRDPSGLARPGLTYHFFNDGHSNCRVFVARD